MHLRMYAWMNAYIHALPYMIQKSEDKLIASVGYAEKMKKALSIFWQHVAKDRQVHA